MSKPSQGPSPLPFFQAVNAYQLTQALRGAVELDLFTAIAEGHATPAALSEKLGVPQRAVRILSDFLTVSGLLEKEGEGYALTADTAVFLDRRSPAYVGGSLDFLLSDEVRGSFNDVAGCVRKGGTLRDNGGSMAPENPLWVTFARAMAAFMAEPARRMAERAAPASGPLKVLDIAAGHGMFGIAVAQRNPEAQIHALDWPAVLEVASANAQKAGVHQRHHLLPGSAFDTEFGTGYDLALVTNFLHHFDPATCKGLLRKVRASLNEKGRVVVLDFVPDEGRVGPPQAVAFALTMLVSTAQGDTYTQGELDAMCRAAGFSRTELVRLDPMPSSIVLGWQ